MGLGTQPIQRRAAAAAAARGPPHPGANARAAQGGRRRGRGGRGGAAPRRWRASAPGSRRGPRRPARRFGPRASPRAANGGAARCQPEAGCLASERSAPRGRAASPGRGGGPRPPCAGIHASGGPHDRGAPRRRVWPRPDHPPHVRQGVQEPAEAGRVAALRREQEHAAGQVPGLRPAGGQTPSAWPMATVTEAGEVHPARSATQTSWALEPDRSAAQARARGPVTQTCAWAARAAATDTVSAGDSPPGSPSSHRGRGGRQRQRSTSGFSA